MAIEAVAEAGGATTIISRMKTIKRQITTIVEDAVEAGMDEVEEVEESNAIIVGNMDIMHPTAEASQLNKSSNRTLQKHRLSKIQHCS